MVCITSGRSLGILRSNYNEGFRLRSLGFRGLARIWSRDLLNENWLTARKASQLSHQVQAC